MPLKKTIAMPDSMTSSRHQILLKLLENKNGMQIDEVSKHLKISRTAVQNHFQVLEKQNLVKKHARAKTMGRPAISYILTDEGNAYFPKHYALLSNALLQELKVEMGSDQLTVYMQKLGRNLAGQYQSRFENLSEDMRINKLFELMMELGFHAKLQRDTQNSTAEINAYNCIYHDIAQQFHEICSLDISMMETLLNKRVDLHTCMVRGDGVCCLRISVGKG